MSPRRAEIDAFMRGARMGYEDCAKLALHFAKRSGSFMDSAAEAKLNQDMALIASRTIETMCTALAETFIEKIDGMEAAASGLEHGIQ